MNSQNTRRGNTQINKHVVICPPCGESTLKGGKGVVDKTTLLDNPLSALRATSPTQGGKSMRRGFTLIELLVVVLIIGILAAVAVPQYQKAVNKSRFAALKPIAKAVKDAQEIYFETTGDYATSSELAKLDITIPEGTDLQLSTTDSHAYVSVGSTKLDNRFRIYFNHSENFAGNIYCEALTADDPLCLAEGGVTGGPTQGQYTLYLLSGNSTGGFAPTYTLSSCGNSCTRYTSEDAIIDVNSSSGYSIIVSENCINFSPSQCTTYTFWNDGTPRDAYNSKSLCDRYPFIEQCQ